MQNNNLVRKASIFSIVSSLIFVFKFDSMFKIVISSVVLANDSEMPRIKGKYDLISKFLENIGYLLPTNNLIINYCFESFQILENNGFIKIVNNEISVLKQPDIEPPFFYNKTALINCLEQIKLLSDKSFLLEVMQYV